MLHTNLVAVRKITTETNLSVEGRKKAQQLSELMETAGGSVQPLILVAINPNEFKLAVMADEQVLILEAARMLRERNLRAGEMINAYLVNTIDSYRPEILDMARLIYPDAMIVPIEKVPNFQAV
jgi:hypothetical protein